MVYRKSFIWSKKVKQAIYLWQKYKLYWAIQIIHDTFSPILDPLPLICHIWWYCSLPLTPPVWCDIFQFTKLLLFKAFYGVNWLKKCHVTLWLTPPSPMCHLWHPPIVSRFIWLAPMCMRVSFCAYVWCAWLLYLR